MFVGISLPALCTGLAGLILCSSAHAQTIRPSTQKELKVFDPTASATGHIGIRAAAGTVSYTLTLPAAEPSVNQVLSANAVSGGTVSLTWATPFSGTGTLNYLSKFASAGTLTNSLLFDNGTNVGIGTTDPTEAKLVVNSDIAVGESGENSLSAVSGSKTWIGSNRLRYNSITNNFSRTNALEQGAMIVLDNESDIKFYNQNSTDQSGTYSLNPTMTLLGTGTTGGGGNVGIGPITPTARLEVRGAGSNSATTALEVDNSSGSPLLTVRDDGNVGIGTSPISRLHLVDDIGYTADNTAAQLSSNLLIQSAYGARRPGTGAAIGFIIPANTNGTNLYSQGRILVTPDNATDANASGRMYLQTRYYNGSVWAYRDNLVLASSGDVGIGTITPTARLEVSGGDARITKATTGTDLSSYSVLYLDLYNNQVATSAVAPLIFTRRARGTASAPAAVQASDQLGGIAVTGATGSTFASGARAGMFSYASESWTTTSNGTELQFWTTPNGNSTMDRRMIIANNGKVSVGDTDPVGRFEVKANSADNEVLEVEDNNEVSLFRVSRNGDIRAGMLTGIGTRALSVTSAGVLTTSSSDARLKTNIEVIPNALQKVMGLRGVTYNWRDGRDTTRVLGMIAQEMLKVAPELVFQNNNGYYGIHYAETTGLLVEAIKEQQKVIEQLKAEQTTTSSLLRQLQLDLQSIQKPNTVHKE
jgi:hypothetical protein